MPHDELEAVRDIIGLNSSGTKNQDSRPLMLDLQPLDGPAYAVAYSSLRYIEFDKDEPAIRAVYGELHVQVRGSGLAALYRDWLHQSLARIEQVAADQPPESPASVSVTHLQITQPTANSRPPTTMQHAVGELADEGSATASPSDIEVVEAPKPAASFLFEPAPEEATVEEVSEAQPQKRSGRKKSTGAKKTTKPQRKRTGGKGASDN